MSGPFINIASDYGGEHKASNYHTLSAVYLDLSASSEWESRRRLVRTNHLPDGRRMSFKKLGDRQRQQALIPFLQAANEITGVCVTLAIRKSILYLCSDEGESDITQKRLSFESRWGEQSFERMLRISHLISLLIAGFSHPGQDIYWVSDEDSMFDNRHYRD